MPEGLRRVECYQAFRWRCLDCDTENFDRAKRVVFADPVEEAREREALGVTDEDGFIVTAPDTVTCRQCLAMFGLGEE